MFCIISKIMRRRLIYDCSPISKFFFQTSCFKESTLKNCCQILHNQTTQFTLREKKKKKFKTRNSNNKKKEEIKRVVTAATQRGTSCKPRRQLQFEVWKNQFFCTALLRLGVAVQVRVKKKKKNTAKSRARE